MFQIHREYSQAKTNMLKDEDVFDLLVSNAIDRNFSGKKKAKSPFKSAWELNDIYYKLAREVSYAKKKDPDVLSMIGQNLISDYSRHLMLFYDSYTTSKLLIDSLKGFIKNNLMTNETKIIVLNGITDEQEIEQHNQQFRGLDLRRLHPHHEGHGPSIRLPVRDSQLEIRACNR
jgi:hypothetical protein